jgi:hypothetical protein
MTAPATLLVFWDYDTQWGADRSRLPGGVKGWGQDEFPCTDELLEIHAALDVPACFAVVGSAAEPGERPYHDPGQIRAIAAAGHEVASHSHRHDWIPGLGVEGLRATLRESRAALEDCIGAPVVSFVPPFNQPFDLPRRLAFSRGERREVPQGRVGLPRLCAELAATGYRFCRVSYHGVEERLRGPHRPTRPISIGGLTCLRVNTGGGFGATALDVLRRAAGSGGVVVAYGHPHSLHAGGSQDRDLLVPFLEEAAGLRDDGRLRILRPLDLLGEPA